MKLLVKLLLDEGWWDAMLVLFNVSDLAKRFEPVGGVVCETMYAKSREDGREPVNPPQHLFVHDRAAKESAALRTENCMERR